MINKRTLAIINKIRIPITFILKYPERGFAFDRQCAYRSLLSHARPLFSKVPQLISLT